MGIQESELYRGIIGPDEEDRREFNDPDRAPTLLDKFTNHFNSHKKEYIVYSSAVVSAAVVVPVTVNAEVGPQLAYLVMAGDSLASIAQRVGVTVEQLVQYNQNKYPSLAENPNDISTGWELSVSQSPSQTVEAVVIPPVSNPPEQRRIDVGKEQTTLSHEDFVSKFNEATRNADQEKFVADFESLMHQTAQGLVVENGEWIIPSPAYAQYFFMRDSFWALMALRDKSLSEMTVRKFKEDQEKYSLDGHIATALTHIPGAPEASRDRDEESTMMYVLHNLLLKRLGGEVDKASLEKAYGFISSHVDNGRYVTYGERRTGPAFDGANQLGTYHYWADTYRPSGRQEATPEVIAYNQGLYAVTLRALQEMGLAIDPGVLQKAEQVYAQMANPVDGVSLPLKEGSSAMDVSALVGEALSLYYFDNPLLSSEKVAATLRHLARAYYNDGSFVGYKVISSYDGSNRPDQEFTVPSSNTSGDYQNGASWFLYDVLANYAGARHGVDDAVQLIIERSTSSVKLSWGSHEFQSTKPTSLGASEGWRDSYGWNSAINAFVSAK
ncbi:MAG: LysM domain-containing protein [bacterium]|nr:LysM domain-containing protein [bacterium]